MTSQYNNTEENQQYYHNTTSYKQSTHYQQLQEDEEIPKQQTIAAGSGRKLKVSTSPSSTQQYIDSFPSPSDRVDSPLLTNNNNNTSSSNTQSLHHRHSTMDAETPFRTVTPLPHHHIAVHSITDSCSNHSSINTRSTRNNSNTATPRLKELGDIELTEIPSETLPEKEKEVYNAVNEQPDDEVYEKPKTHLFHQVLPGPPCVRNIIGNELCERFSYYGLRAILVLYLTEGLNWQEDFAISIYSYWVALAYFMPLLGGYVSDSYLGKYRTIIYFSLIYCSGSIILAVTAISPQVWGCVLGLILIGIGTGGIKPCVSSFGADQFLTTVAPSKREHAISVFFHVFYFAINLGSVFSFIFTPLLREHAGYDIAFGVPAILLLVATAIFWSARKQYVILPPTGSVVAQIYHVIRAARKTRHQTVEDGHWLDTAVGQEGCSVEAIENAKALVRVAPIFAVLPAFWMLFDQQSSSWTLQAKHMNRYGLEPEQIGVINPVLIMILLPVMEKIVYPTAQKCVNLTPLRRMGVGMLIAVLAFLASAGLEYKIQGERDQSVGIFWQLPQILLISIAEIMISVTGLEFAYTQAPVSLKSVIAALFLLTTAIGNIFTGIIYNALSSKLDMVKMFLVFSGLMLFDFFIFLWVATRFKPATNASLEVNQRPQPSPLSNPVITNDVIKPIEESKEQEEEEEFNIQH